MELAYLDACLAIIMAMFQLTFASLVQLVNLEDLTFPQTRPQYHVLAVIQASMQAKKHQLNV
jgi:hypothetical protein